MSGGLEMPNDNAVNALAREAASRRAGKLRHISRDLITGAQFLVSNLKCVTA
jgi:hypothetical protein